MRWPAFSQTTGYALKTLSILCASEDDWKRAGDLSREAGIPANYLSKILNQLGKRGFVVGRKGWGGGFRLSKSAKARSIQEVIELFEGKIDIDTCVFGLVECDPTNPCSMHQHWDPVKRAFMKMLNEVTIGDFCGERKVALPVDDVLGSRIEALTKEVDHA